MLSIIGLANDDMHFILDLIHYLYWILFIIYVGSNLSFMLDLIYHLCWI